MYIYNIMMETWQQLGMSMIPQSSLWVCLEMDTPILVETLSKDAEKAMELAVLYIQTKAHLWSRLVSNKNQGQHQVYSCESVDSISTVRHSCMLNLHFCW